MKKLIIALVILLGFNMSYSQGEEFAFPLDTVSHEIVTSYNLRNSYVVLNIKGSEDELYKKTLVWINESFQNPEKVIQSKVEGSMIKIVGSGPLFAKEINGDIVPHETKYEVTFKFKQNKIRIDIPNYYYWMEGLSSGDKEIIKSYWQDNHALVIKTYAGSLISLNETNIILITEYLNLEIVSSLKSAISKEEEW